MLKIFDKISSSSLPQITAAKIICGDCGGDELLPKMTSLTTDGTCADCGGRNWEFAARLAMRLAQHLKSKDKNYDNDTKNINENTTGNCIEISGSLRH